MDGGPIMGWAHYGPGGVWTAVCNILSPFESGKAVQFGQQSQFQLDEQPIVAF